MKQRRSRKGAWIEIGLRRSTITVGNSRSRKGAWIEIYQKLRDLFALSVAPVRERGLKW